MARNAKRALRWHKKHGSGMTRVGLKRANDIADQRDLSLDTVKRMHSFFSRHEQASKNATGFNYGEPGFPSDGRKAWDGWGGDAGQKWSKRITESEKKKASKNSRKKKASLSRRGKFGPLLLKHILFTGSFIDESGNKVDVTPEYVEEAIKGTQQLWQHRFNIRNFTDHDAVNSNEVLGTWQGLYFDGNDLFGVVEAHSEAAAAKMERLDASAVFETDIPMPNGVSIPFAITRIDTVPQGAVTGTMPYVRLSRARRKKSMKFTKALAKACGLSEYEDMREIDEAMSAALMSGDVTAEELGAVITEQLKEMSQSSGDAEEKAPASEMSAEDSEDMTTEEMAAEYRKMSAYVKSQQRKEMQREIESCNTEEKKKLSALYNKHSKAFGHEDAIGVIRTALSMRPKAKPSVTLAKRPQYGAVDEAKLADAKERMKNAMARRFGKKGA
jgi:hypothetical protein